MHVLKKLILYNISLIEQILWLFCDFSIVFIWTFAESFLVHLA